MKKIDINYAEDEYYSLYSIICQYDRHLIVQ
jgi:hypothetical protein